MSTANQTAENPSQYRITPRYGLYSEQEKVILQVALPGVKKADISMKALKDYFSLRAKRGEVEYVLDLDFGVKISPEKTVSEYSEGLLRLEFQRYNPLEHAYEVPIQ